MQTELTQLVNTIEYTSEMRELQKDYENLIKLSELLDNAQELLTDLFDTKPVCMNGEIKQIFAKRKRLDSTTALKEIGGFTKCS